MIRIEEFRGQRLSGDLKIKWNELLENSYEPNFQYKEEYINVWLEENSNSWRPMILLFIENDEVIGILPLMIKLCFDEKIMPVKTLRILGSFMIDFSVMICGNSQNIEKITSLFFEWLKTNKRIWDLMILDDIKENNPWYMEIVHNLKKNNYLYYHNKYNNYYIKMDNLWENIYSKTSKKFVRRNISLSHNRIEKDYGKGTLDFVFNPNWDINTVYNNILIIKEKEFSDTKNNLDKYYEKMLIKLLIENETFVSFWLSIEKRFIAYGYGFIEKNKFYWWQTAYDSNYSKYSPGRLLLYYALNYFSEESSEVNEFNFMRGSNFYKSKWTNKYNIMNDFYVYNNTFYAKLMYIYKYIKRGIKYCIGKISAVLSGNKIFKFI